MIADLRQWQTLEKEDKDLEGFVLVPAQGTGDSYVASGPSDLFQSEEVANEVLLLLIRRGTVGLGELKVVPARLKHQRHLEIALSPPGSVLVEP